MSELKKKKILVVDDEKDIVDSLSSFLEKSGYETCAAENGKDALRLAKDVLPDLIILDLMLPDIDGSDVAAELVQNQSTSKIPIVFLTAVLTRDEQLDGGDKVARWRILAKPCQPGEVLRLVREYIGVP